jgi:hypothetical protein
VVGAQDRLGVGFVGRDKGTLVAALPPAKVEFLEARSRGGNRHIGAVVSTDDGLLSRVREAWQVLSRMPT